LKAKLGAESQEDECGTLKDFENDMDDECLGCYIAMEEYQLPCPNPNCTHKICPVEVNFK
jgi:hypothetical protein